MRGVFRAEYTPTLTAAAPPGVHVPLGLVFSTFMLSCMAGSTTFRQLTSPAACTRCMVTPRSADALLPPMLLLGSAALCVPWLASMPPVAHALSQGPEALRTLALLGAFLAFEFCVGIYWPAIGTVKAVLVPEAVRATMYNLFRVPLNVVVLVVLLTDLPPPVAFAVTSVLLAVGLACELWRQRCVRSSARGESRTSVGAGEGLLSVQE